MKNYYSKAFDLVYNNPESPFDSMFYFNLTDEEWKQTDDDWGIFFQGDSNGLGNAKFKSYEIIIDIIFGQINYNNRFNLQNLNEDSINILDVVKNIIS